MKIVLAFALLIVIAKANPFEDAQVEEQEPRFEPEVKEFFVDRSMEREVNPYKDAFDMFDEDGDGIVSINDMVKLIKSSGLSYNGDKLRQRIKQADANGDKAIDFDEYMTLYIKVKGSFGQGNFDFEKYFGKFDKDGDGFISKSEFKKKIKSVYKKLGKDITNDVIKDAFKLIDSNGDGMISLDEFENMTNIPLPRRAARCCTVIIITRR